MQRKNLTIGLFGFGCVGYGLFEVLQKTPGLKARIKKICIKDPHKQRLISAENFTYDKNELLNDPEINLIVELIDDADAAFEIVSTALKNGKAVVSANKKMIAENFEELIQLQQQYKAPLLYEAACCASIPIIRNLEEYFDNDLLESLEGIVNGSTNYILTKTFSENLSYQDALKEAQSKGYAETNPILDTGGFDAKYKLLILNAHAFGIISKPEEIFNTGIDTIDALELQYAREKGLKIKLVANAFKTYDGNITTFVMPKFISANERLYQVDDVFNGVITKTCFADTQFFVGKGAGAHPTASAVLSDISALTYHYKYEYKKLKRNESLLLQDNVLLKIMFRYNNHDDSLSNFFTEVEESYSNQNSSYMIGSVTLQNLKLLLKAKSNSSCVLFKVINETY